jgi:hypothetical protein
MVVKAPLAQQLAPLPSRAAARTSGSLNALLFGPEVFSFQLSMFKEFQQNKEERRFKRSQYLLTTTYERLDWVLNYV